MSINFQAEVKVTTTYRDDEGKVEHIATPIESTLDLGNFRMLRYGIIQQDGDCGSKTFDAEEFVRLCFRVNSPQTNSAAQYVMALRHIEDPDRTAETKIEVLVTGA